MSKKDFIVERLNEVLLNGRWVANTNIKQQIETITWQQAIQKVGKLNTIAALTFHITYYIKGVANVLVGGPLEIRDKFSFDMPKINSESDWNELVNDFVSSSEKFIHVVQQMDETKMDENFVETKYGSYEKNIVGIIEHCYYHLGQISLLKRMIL